MPKKVILLIEDNPDDEALTLRAFKKNNILNKVVVVHDGAEALEYLFGTGAHAGRDANEDPQHLAEVTVPVSAMPIHSIFVRPEPGEQLHAGISYTVQGVANDGGSGVRRVEVSTDGGQTWSDATLGTDLGKYSWRRWQAQWTPRAKGTFNLMVRATAGDGQTQRTSQWTRSGYQRDIIEHLEVVVA